LPIRGCELTVGQVFNLPLECLDRLKTCPTWFIFCRSNVAGAARKGRPSKRGGRVLRFLERRLGDWVGVARFVLAGFLFHIRRGGLGSGIRFSGTRVSLGTRVSIRRT